MFSESFWLIFVCFLFLDDIFDKFFLVMKEVDLGRRWYDLGLYRIVKFIVEIFWKVYGKYNW